MKLKLDKNFSTIFINGIFVQISRIYTYLQVYILEIGNNAISYTNGIVEPETFTSRGKNSEDAVERKLVTRMLQTSLLSTLKTYTTTSTFTPY